jgi:hypothetical protein
MDERWNGALVIFTAGIVALVWWIRRREFQEGLDELGRLVGRWLGDRDRE